MSAPALFGTPERRLDGDGKTNGATKYTADIALPGALESAFVRSPYPHARIRSVDASRARALPGVRAVITGADVNGARLGRRLQDWPVLCWDRVLFVGDRVAAVAADTRAIADEAVRLTIRATSGNRTAATSTPRSPVRPASSSTSSRPRGSISWPSSPTRPSCGSRTTGCTWSRRTRRRSRSAIRWPRASGSRRSASSSTTGRSAATSGARAFRRTNTSSTSSRRPPAGRCARSRGWPMS